MRQALFVKQNETKWKGYEDKLKKLSSLDMDELKLIYVDLTEDYAFSRAKYPEAGLTQYLNELTLKTHQFIYRNKPERAKRLISIDELVGFEC